jgi:hypothetical protein
MLPQIRPILQLDNSRAQALLMGRLVLETQGEMPRTVSRRPA